MNQMRKIAIVLVLLTSTFFVAAQSGSCKTGDCENGYGTYLWNSGSTYTGNWKNGKMNGMGNYNFIEKHLKGGGNDFESYEGNWKDNLYDGIGIYKKGILFIKKEDIHLNSVTIYEGNWSNGRYNGYGVYTFQEGSKNNEILQDAKKYEGNWVNGYREGKGKSYNNFVNNKGFFESWELFDGDWKDDKRNGLGTMYEKNGTVTKGKWKNDIRIETYETYNSNAGKFTGKLKDGIKSGKGQLYLYDGTIVEGEFVNNQFEGNGKIIYLDGSVYEGEIKDYKASGYGKTTLYGNVHKGNYLNGKANGMGTYTGTNGQSFEGDYKDGKQMWGKYYQMKKFIFEGTHEDYIVYMNNSEIEFKKYLAGEKLKIDAENERKRLAEEQRLSSMTEEEKLIEKYPCPFCGGKGTFLCGGEYMGTKVLETRTYGNVEYRDEVTLHAPDRQCPCHWCDGKKYFKSK